MDFSWKEKKKRNTLGVCIKHNILSTWHWIIHVPIFCAISKKIILWVCVCDSTIYLPLGKNLFCNNGDLKRIHVIFYCHWLLYSNCYMPFCLIIFFFFNVIASVIQNLEDDRCTKLHKIQMCRNYDKDIVLYSWHIMLYCSLLIVPKCVG